MDWHGIVGIIGGLIQMVSIIPYIKSMLHGTTRPNVVTQILWTILQIIAIAAQFSAGASWSVIILIVLTFNTSFVIVLCFRGYGYKKYGTIDKVCFVLAILAIILWQITKEPAIAILLSIFADFLATFPTIMKTYREPHSEAVFPWFLTLIASTSSAISTTIFNFANLAFPIYMIAIDSVVTGIAFFGQRKKKVFNIDKN